MNTGVIYRDDNLQRLALLPADSVDLIYLDPPFFSNRHYEVIWGDEAEVRSFEDRWEGGIYHYIEWMKERVFEMKRVLKPDGAFFLHCDDHAAHYLKVMLDDVFGSSNFRNEIIWHYKFRMMSNSRLLNRKHDSIFFYAKNASHRIVPPTEPWTRDEIIRVRKQAIHKDEQGKEWVWMPGPKGRSKNKHKYLSEIIAEGKALDDVWDLPTVTSSAKERMGYPTQKPEVLLERIVSMSSQPGDIVLDPFAGCGTTLVAAQRLKRNWIGIDISPTACDLMKRRLLKVGAEANLEGMPQSLDDLKELKPFEFQNWIIVRISGHQSDRKSGDMGIDGWTFFLHDPVQVKQSESVGRPVIDSFETAITRANKKRGFVIALSFTRGAYEEVARVKSSGLDIHLITVADLLDRQDEIAALMSTLSPTGELPGLGPEAAPMPTIDSRRRSADELIRSAKGGPEPN